MSGRPEAGVGEVAHLIRRFCSSVRPGPPPSADECWALARLNEGEKALWRRMSNPDRRHALGVARGVADQLGPRATRPVLAAALLHDVGKVESGFRTPARVAATLLWAVVPDERASEWLRHDGGWRHRLAQYRRHPAIGEELLVEAGSDPLTSSWAGDHHRSPERWRVDRALASVLKACDDD